MKRNSNEKVKKTLVRNCEQKIKPIASKYVVRDVDACSSSNLAQKKSPGSSQKENNLNQPSLCSSDALANYLADLKHSSPPLLSDKDLNIDKGKLCSKMTKKLNFHYNDRMYRNLVELNANIEDLKTKKHKRPTSSTASIRKDLEPNIEDFFHDEKEVDLPPNIPVIKRKHKAVKKFENGDLHKLVVSFEVL